MTCKNLFKVNNEDNRTLSRQYRRSGVFTINFEKNSHIVLVDEGKCRLQ